MTRNEYFKRALELLNSDNITVEVYDAMLMNADCFVDEEDVGIDPRFPKGYAEIEYSDFENAEAVSGARFDDMNYQRYIER